jgi:hypothetical protein
LLFQAPAKPLGKGTPVAGKVTPKRTLKQIRKENALKALKNIKNKVPAEGRSVFKDGDKVSEGEIEPFEDHDALMRKAGKIMISFSPPVLPS